MIYRSLAELGPGLGPSVVTIGNFDGVHAGHRRILRRAVALSHELGAAATVLTFDPHPAKVVAPERAPRLLTTPEERAGLMFDEGIQRVVILPFDRQFASLSPEEFARDVLVGRLQARAVLVGDNFRFGARQTGDVKVLQALGEVNGFRTEIIGSVRLRGRLVSSTVVRRLIEAGNLPQANRLLERAYSLSGEVVPGRGVGARQTVATLNLRTGAEVLPAIGVYITRTTDLANPERQWNSITNVGVRPTFGGGELSIETHLLDSFAPPTPARIRVEFLRRLRDERNFESPEALKAQILRDAARARTYFRRLARLGKC